MQIAHQRAAVRHPCVGVVWVVSDGGLSREKYFHSAVMQLSQWAAAGKLAAPTVWLCRLAATHGGGTYKEAVCSIWCCHYQPALSVRPTRLQPSLTVAQHVCRAPQWPFSVTRAFFCWWASGLGVTAGAPDRKLSSLPVRVPAYTGQPCITPLSTLACRTPWHGLER